MPKGNRTIKPWPNRQWRGKEGDGGFIVEDDQGYNFSFPTRPEAEWFRATCSDFQKEMEKVEGDMIRKYREHLRA